MTSKYLKLKTNLLQGKVCLPELSLRPNNQSMLITTLKQSPHLVSKTLALIEHAFHYSRENSFRVDFAPLMRESNHHNCFVMLDENEKLVAHIGVCERRLLGHPVAMLGGIAVAEDQRGQGHFNQLMTHVLVEKRDEVALFLLWSDQEKLYKKLGFYLCGEQYELAMISGARDFTRTRLHDLSEAEKRNLQELYTTSFQRQYLTLERAPADWKALEEVTSADLYIKKSGDQVEDYFFMNKGQDLTSIVYEYGSKSDLRVLLNACRAYGKVWMGKPIVDADTTQYQFFMAPGETRQFGHLIKDFTQGKFILEHINLLKQEVFFHFNDELLSLEVEEFLRGVFGPSPFEELDEVPRIFISGLESI